VNSPALSPAFCAANGVVVIAEDGDGVSFGLLDPGDAALKARIKKAFPRHHCLFATVSREEFNLKLSRAYADGGSDTDSTEASGDSLSSAIDQVSGDAPVINLLNSLFLEALSKKASDIHIESEKDEARVRFRVDGLLLPVRSVSRERAAALSARLKLLARLNVLENRRPQDGHIDIRSEDYSVDVRISVTPTVWGESVVLRLLNRSDISFSLDTLGFSAGQRQALDGVTALASGLVLVTGPTGSGKTTTLAALLKILNTVERKIISLEDPVEYRVAGITQIQINEELGLTFDALLRRLFRQDPDIIMVGEIRDSETAELSVRAALTGHLVFATLHTTDAVEAVYRLRDMGVRSYMLAAVLRFCLAQRLIRRLCPGCGGAGCPGCSGSGYSGRTVVSETIAVTEELSGLIGGGITPGKLRSLLAGRGHKTMLDDAKEKAEAGITSESEIRRELGML
jgi:general secretion pathway protein E/type IV pilus assembly protein PilB